MRRHFLNACRHALIASAFALTCSAWGQAIFNVDSTADLIDDDTTDGVCHTSTGKCTLRAAVMQANRIPNGGATIMLPAGTYLLNRPPTVADGEDNGDLNLNIPAGYAPGPTTIIGSGAATTIIDGSGYDRVFVIDIQRTVNISGVSIIHGSAAAYGGGIYNAGSLTLADCVIRNNAAAVGAASRTMAH